MLHTKAPTTLGAQLLTSLAKVLRGVRGVAVATAKVTHNVIELLALSRKATFMDQMFGQLGTILLGVRFLGHHRAVLCQTQKDPFVTS